MSSMKLRHRNPCDECPWRREAFPGFMGGHPVQEYADMARFQVPTACHKTVTDDPVHTTSICAGMAQHLNNSCSRPRDREYAQEVEKAGANPGVFQWVSEFLTHHARDPMAWMRERVKLP